MYRHDWIFSIHLVSLLETQISDLLRVCKKALLVVLIDLGAMQIGS